MGNKKENRTAKVIEWQPPHFLKMINWEWQCCDCGHKQAASMSEEEDFLGQKFVIISCYKCRLNNKIIISEIYDSRG